MPQAWPATLVSVHDFISFTLSHSVRSLFSTAVGTGLLAASIPLIPIILALFFLRTSNDSTTAIMANGPTFTGNGAVSNGKHADPSADFKGDIRVNNKAPTKELLEKLADIPVLDVNKKSHTFKSLYSDNEHGPRRALVVFIRHFFCGVRTPSFFSRLAAYSPAGSIQLYEHSLSNARHMTTGLPGIRPCPFRIHPPFHPRHPHPTHRDRHYRLRPA